MDRFEGAFHQSDLKAYLKCPRSFYYNRVLGLDKEKVSMANLAGRAGHYALEVAHGEQVWDPGQLFDAFMARLEAEKFRAIDRGLDLHGNVDTEKYRVMLAEYVARDFNREFEPILLEANFYYIIKPSRTEYQFTGRIDQLGRVKTSVLRKSFPNLLREFDKPDVVLHRDAKFGRRKEVSAFELALNVQFDVYAYGLKYGMFWTGEAGFENDEAPPTDDAPRCLNLVPDYHVVYYIQDHIPYESDAGTYLKDENGERVPCDIWPALGLDGPCPVGKTQKPCEGKRSWCTKQSRGPGMYFTKRPEARLASIPAELGRVCASIRMGHYPRCQGELCFNYCQFRGVCESEVMQELEA